MDLLGKVVRGGGLDGGSWRKRWTCWGRLSEVGEHAGEAVRGVGHAGGGCQRGWTSWGRLAEGRLSLAIVTLVTEVANVLRMLRFGGIGAQRYCLWR